MYNTAITQHGFQQEDGTLLLDTGSQPHRLCQYSAAGLCWTVRTDTAVRIAAKGIGALFRAGDGVFLSGCREGGLDGAHILLDAAADSIRFEGILDAGFVQQTPIVVTRKMPDLDFAVEVNNRIWGCNSAAREIYACALRDPFNWNTFAGTAADSYAASVGTLGAFTGAAAYQGAALFFKEGCVHKVLGSKPANFQVTFAPLLGVKAGAAASLALCEGNLLYQAADGVRVYGSGGTTLLSGRWGRDAAGCAGAVGGKYYLALPGRGVLCYDLASGLWHREGAAAVLGFAETGGTLYAQMRDGSVWRMAGEEVAGTAEESVAWQAVTGEIALRTGAGSYVGGLYLRAMLEAGSTMKIEASYDESGSFRTVYEIAGAAKRTYELPILPRLCESMRLALQSMEQKITDRGLDVEADIPEDSVMVQGVNDLITQVIYNLLENATKFAAPGSTLYLGLTETGGDKAVVTVRNTGHTIPAEEIPLLFERFHKSDKSRSEDKDGYGLGLYVVKTILSQHKEKITVTSENGVTSFSFTVQLAHPMRNT